VKVINWKHRTEFYWADCTHKLNSNEHTDCPYCRIAELECECKLMAAHQGIDNYQRCLDRIAALEAELTQERKDLHEAWDLYQAAKAKLDAVQATIKRIEGLPPDLTRSEQGGFGEPLIVEYVKRVNIQYAALAGEST